MVVMTREGREQRSVQWTRAELVPGSWRDQDRSVEVVLSTGARGRRRKYTGWDSVYEYDEELEISSSSIRMARLQGGCAVLDSHQGYSVRSVVGRVVPESARIDGGKLIARLQLSVAPEDAGLVANVRAGIVNAISMGYRTYKETIDETQSPPVHRATDWEIYEVSFVPINFDAGAVTRAATDHEQPNECTVIRRHNRSEEAMDPELEGQNPSGAPTNGGQNQNRGTQPVVNQVVIPTQTRTGAPAAAAAAAAPAAAPVAETRSATATLDVEQHRREGAAAEQRRQSEIRSLANRLRIGNDLLDPILADSTRSLEQARATFLEAVAVRSDATSPRPMGHAIQLGDEERTKVRAAVEFALLHRADSYRYTFDPNAPVQRRAPDGSRDFAGMSLTRLGEELVRRQDPSFRLSSRDELVRRMFSTSDFPNIAEGAIRRTLREQYDEQTASFEPFVRRTTMQDFRQTNRLQLSAAANLLEVPQNGEIEASEMGESAEGYKLTSFARIVSINRQTIINDDLQAFSKVPMLLANAARRLESDKVYAILTANAAMSDTVALFHANHGNLITPALALAGLTAMRLAMRKQTGQQGELLNLVPKVLIVPAALETTAWQLINGEIFAATNATANPFKGSLTLVVEPRLDVASATVWYSACNPAQCDTIELATLEGSTGPMVEREEMFNVLGMSVRVVHDIGTKAIDFRGLQKSSATT